jgi:hypothetical protein
MKLLASFCYKDFTRNRITRAIFLGGKFWKRPFFGAVRGGFTFYSSFFILLTTKVIMRPLAVPKDGINSNPYWII